MTDRRVLIFSVDPMPLPGLPTNGGGLRTWSLAEGLRSRGHEVIVSLPRKKLADKEGIDGELLSNAFDLDEMTSVVRRVAPDLVLFEQWALATYLAEADVPVAIDLNGSLILENAYRQHRAFVSNAAAKIKALRKADLLLCAGERQKSYFTPWLMMAGLDPREVSLAVVPFSLSPQTPTPKREKVVTFVFGGTPWPWIDPQPGLEVLLQTLAAQKMGRLRLHQGDLPDMQILESDQLDPANFRSYNALVQPSPQVEVSGPVPYQELLDVYLSSHAALDLYQLNAERELALTTRTFVYLWSGLPVLHANYAELAGPIGEYKAGYVLAPQDREAIGQAIVEILHHPDRAEEMGAQAQRLMRERFAWDRTIEPLDRFLQDPKKSTPRSSIFRHISLEFDRIETETRKELSTLQEQIKAQGDALRRLQADQPLLGGLAVESLREEMGERGGKVEQLVNRAEEVLASWEAEKRKLDAEIDRDFRSWDVQIEKVSEDISRRELEISEEIRRLNQEREEEIQRCRVQIEAIIQQADGELRTLRNRVDREVRARDEEIVRLTNDVQRRDERIKALTEQIGQTLAELETRLNAKEGLMGEVTRKLAQYDGCNQSMEADLDRQRREREGLEADLARAKRELEEARQEVERQRGIVRSFKDRLPFRVFKRTQVTTKRLITQWPGLIQAYGLTLANNLYMRHWERINRIKIFPG